MNLTTGAPDERTPLQRYADAAGLIEPIAADTFKDLEATLSDADGLRIGQAFVEILKVGLRVGAAEIIASVTEQARELGVVLDLHNELHDTSDEDEHT